MNKFLIITVTSFMAGVVMPYLELADKHQSLVSDIMLYNAEALSNGETSEQACVAGGNGCPFHGMWIADSHEYKH